MRSNAQARNNVSPTSSTTNTSTEYDGRTRSQPYLPHGLPPDDVLSGVYALCMYEAAGAAAGGEDTITFVGTCFAVSPLVVLTAGHHYIAASDKVEHFGVAAALRHTVPQDSASPTAGEAVGRGRKGHQAATAARTTTRPHRLLAKASYLQKSVPYDVLILWLDRPLPHTLSLRARKCLPGAPIWTLWLRRNAFDCEPLVLSPGVVVQTNEKHCTAQGTVTDKGSSGAPVVCGISGVLLGMHLGANALDGQHVTEFVGTHTLVDLMIGAGVETRKQRCFSPLCQRILTCIPSHDLSNASQLRTVALLPPHCSACEQGLRCSMDHSHGADQFDLQGLTLKEVVAGGVAGLAEHVGMFPFDTIKTRMQSEGSTLRAVATKIFYHERWAHLYRGCVPVLCSAVPAHGAYFSIYEAVKRRMGKRDDSFGVAVSALCATLAHDTVSIPFDVVKQRMQVDATNMYRSSWHCFRTIVAKEGASKLFVSLPTTAAMNIPHMTTQWVVYERIKLYLLRRGEEENEMAWHFVLAGFVAGACAATVSAPLDNVKTKLQLGTESSAVGAMRTIYAHAGLRGFMTGVVPRVCNMAPSAAITLATYELAKSSLAFLSD